VLTGSAGFSTAAAAAPRRLVEDLLQRRAETWDSLLLCSHSLPDSVVLGGGASRGENYWREKRVERRTRWGEDWGSGVYFCAI